MAESITPIQIRTIDPFSSYYSSNVNKLSRMVTNNTDCLFSGHSIDVSLDSTSPLECVIVGEGIGYKDDIQIEITEDFIVDLEDSDFFLGSTPMNIVGYYYIVLKYVYAQTKPAPTSTIRILKPSERSLYTQDSEYLFLKCVKVIHNGSKFVIDELLDYDPETPTNRRLYTPLFAGIEDSLPTFNVSLHEGKIIYVRNLDCVYYGGHTSWEQFGSTAEQITTIDCQVGDIGYVNSSGTVSPAIGTSINTFGECCVLQQGYKSDGSGLVKPYGIVENVPVESLRQISVGEDCYLSGIEAGKVTNVQDATSVQYLGVCIEDSTSFITMWLQSSGGGGGGGSAINSLNIDTLYSDIYIDPSQVDDGLPKLAIPLETCKDNLQTFVGSSGDSEINPNYTSNTIVTDNEDLETSISNLDSWIGFSRKSRNVTDGDSTPSILDGSGKKCGILNIDNTSSTTITNIDDPINGILVILLFNDNNTIIEHGINIKLLDEIDFNVEIDNTLTLVYDENNSIWTEISRKQVGCGGKINTETFTTNHNVNESDFGKSLRMDSVSDRVFNLLDSTSAEDGARITFVKTNSGKVTIQAGGSDTIADGTSIYDSQASETYATLSLEFIATKNKWVITGAHGSWITA